MNRRDFVSRVALGAAGVCTSFAGTMHAAPRTGAFRFRFVGMMGFVERKDHSFLVATPGATHHVAAHVPFLMARKQSVFAKALAMVPVPGVIPAAFDTELEGSRASDFVYRSLDNTTVEVVTGASDRVVNEADQMAQLHDVAPGKRVRGNLERWASSTISLRGGRLENSAAHPDAGKLWSFGSYRQPLTDAVNYRNLPNAPTTIRLTSGVNVSTVTVGADEPSDLWMISSAALDSRMNSPMKLIHSELLFEYLVDATPVVAECPDATGREVPPTALPFTKPTSASMATVGMAAPPLTDFCFIACILLGDSKK